MSCDHLNALLKKNYILTKRSVCFSICEIFLPIVLMLLLVAVRTLIPSNTSSNKQDDVAYLQNNSAVYPALNSNYSSNNTTTFYNLTSDLGISIKSTCFFSNRTGLGVVGSFNVSAPAVFSYLLKTGLVPVYFQSTSDLNSYIQSENMGSPGFPNICFGVSFTLIERDNYNYSLHYYDSMQPQNGIRDIPNQLKPSLNYFQYGPDYMSYQLYKSSSYLKLMSLINNAILQQATGNSTAKINLAMIAQKYNTIQTGGFAGAVSFIFPFFMIIGYVLPLWVVVYNFVSDKESRIKEGMMIMGMKESTYFFSYFIRFLIMNTFYAIINGIILQMAFSFINFFWLFLLFWLFGFAVFSMGFLFQSIIDKTSVAVIISILVYFVMYFVSQTATSDQVGNSAKMAISLLPPSAIQLGIISLAQFEAARLKLSGSNVSVQYNNYSVGNMYGMLIVDVIIYLFLGFYFQNVLAHEFGVKRPFYFLCTRRYWCGASKEEILANLEKVKKEGKRDSNLNQEFYQNEDAYKEQINSGDCLQLKNIVKQYDDGKVAVDGISFNIYKNEIFALLGHNGAGKSTLISLLVGLYEVTEGEAIYDGVKIFDNMDIFRKSVGICPQHDVLFNQLTVREHLELYAVFKGIPSENREKEINQIMFNVKLIEKEECLIDGLSGGQKRKLSIAIALLGGSKVVFLDEPSSGMDITSRRDLWDILKREVSDKIIILTTHYMEEAAVLGNRIGIVANGKLKCSGTGLFLIDKFGKYISLSISKEKDAKDEEIKTFITNHYPDSEFEFLSEEILVKIPKTSSSLKAFFTDLDVNITNLKIKSYGANMPTLEDVFLNVSEDLHIEKKKEKEKEKDKGKEEHDNRVNYYSYDMYEREKENEITGMIKILYDMRASLYKRFLHIVRDKKSFVLEIICPIVLVLIGIGVASVSFLNNSFPKQVTIGLLPYIKQNITINSAPLISQSIPVPSIFQEDNLATFSSIPTPNGTRVVDSLASFNNLLFANINNTSSLAGYFLLNIDNINGDYDAAVFVNMIAQDGFPIFMQDFYNRMISAISGRQIKIQFNSVALPRNYYYVTKTTSRNTGNLVFFACIAFSLIPANFITVLLREKISNMKHLQIVSGVAYSSYWLSNFIFEFVKYLFTGGICIAILSGVNYAPGNLVGLYVLYGLAMIPFTYIFTFIFKTESLAQNFTLLLNIFIGALAGNIIYFLRIITDSQSTNDIAKIIAYILRLVPSFSFSYGYNQLLGSRALALVDYPNTPPNLIPTLDITAPNYAGGDMIYLGCEAILCSIVLILIELFSSKISFAEKNNTPPNNPNLDDDVMEEIKLTNSSNFDHDKYSVQVKNVIKNYSSCFGPVLKNSVNNLSFSLSKGECFALLGLNGAGKTTMFKCLTGEIFPTLGSINVNGMELSENFENVRNLIGYCPQFDAILDFMTVYENLNFFSIIKGIHESKRDLINFSIMKEMNLEEYADKVSGRLSGGNKRKLSVAIAMIGNPPIILLDEPSTGVDPEARRFMWSVIHKISKTKKHSSVILTTHSMEEAETLCRRIAIMVQGQFRCLGTSQHLKDKFGSGFEIDLRIKLLSQEEIVAKCSSLEVEPNKKIKDSEVKPLLVKIKKEGFLKLLKAESLGSEIFEEFAKNKECSVKKILNWVNYTEEIIKLGINLKETYPEVIISEYNENSYKLKVKKNESNNSTIGFLFSAFEDLKEKYHITEYGISQTSLEQIFNKFAYEAELDSQNKVIAKRPVVIEGEILQIVELNKSSDQIANEESKSMN